MSKLWILHWRKQKEPRQTNFLVGRGPLGGKLEHGKRSKKQRQQPWQQQSVCRRSHQDGRCKNVLKNFQSVAAKHQFSADMRMSPRYVATAPTCEVSGINWALIRGCWKVAQTLKPKCKKQHICNLTPLDASQDGVE
jgi:hypothetical protein